MELTKINKLLINKGINPLITKTLIEIGSFLEVKSKSNIVNIGDVCNKIYFIVEGGFVNQYLHHETGSFRTVNFYLSNFQWFTTIPDSYFLNTPSLYQTKAITNSKVFYFNKRTLENLVKEDSLFSQWYYNEVIIALTGEYKSKSQLISFTSLEMYQYLVEHQPEVIKQVPVKYIAEFLGVSREHLSRIRRKANN
jgi:CRP/FNR family transcriptional regulator